MIQIKHPFGHCNKMQEEMIAKTPASEKEFNELLFSYGNASYLYHSNANLFTPNIEDYNEWLSGLEPMVKKAMEECGFDECLNVLSITRYVNKKNDIGMDEYVKRLMGEQNFASHKNIVNNPK
ncbi:hypothetical protein H7U22_22300 [Pedobacter sp. CCM 8938]|uniref:Uncharacterized protein n=1 Tax=Pedobacter fastidiosus TaxID=2765361 RepID=A0ABR7KYG4_9SPHI|nr:hypothetical protein [Pedobacter fastidiosus]MBC6113156.1 hypothetical protein [Pedobacter fastidiosus]